MSAFAGFSRHYDAVALNPQPLPPREFGFADLLRHAGDLVALNPQPLPPEPPETLELTFVIDRPADLVALNPQPLPPEPPEQLLGFGHIGFLVEEGFEQTSPSFVFETDFQDLSATMLL